MSRRSDGIVHVIGGGLAGLSAALTASDAGRQVIVYEAGPACGGRCRSYYDRGLDCRLDNGNHLLLSGNRATFAMLDRIGSRHTMRSPPTAMFPFHDLATGQAWVLRPNAGRLPWWILSAGRRVPGTSAGDYLALARLMRARPGATVRQAMPQGVLYRRLVEPLAIAALNTRPADGSAALLGAIMRETLARGGSACVPALPRDGWSESLADPAVAALRAAGQTVVTGRRIAALAMEGGRVASLREAGRDATALGAGDQVILAVPAERAVALVADLSTPNRYEAIVNLHYKVAAPRNPAGFIGLIGGLAEWLFFKPGIVSVTISAANRLIDTSGDAVVRQVWSEICLATGLSGAAPPVRLVREKRATFAATPEQHANRPSCRTATENIFLAGDWTATGLPATIEGAIRSGRTAGEMVASAA